MLVHLPSETRVSLGIRVVKGYTQKLVEVCVLNKTPEMITRHPGVCMFVTAKSNGQVTVVERVFDEHGEVRTVSQSH